MSSRQSIHSHEKCHLLSNAELDKSWEKFQPQVHMVTCSGGRIINARHGNMRNASILLEFLSDDGERYILYFNAVSNKKGYAVNHNSKFANLYRLVLGANPVSRYSKAQQLIKHFIGYGLHVQKSEQKHDDNGATYYKIINCSPANPVSSIEWNKRGRLKPKTKKKSRLNAEPKSETNRKTNGNELETNRKTNGNELETKNGCEPSKHLVCSDNLPRNNVQRNNVQSDDVYKPIAINQGNTVTYHKRREGESNDEYYDRVIDETF